MSNEANNPDTPTTYTSKIHRDPVAFVIGDYGLWQYKVIFLMALCCMPCVFQIYSPNFVNANMNIWCAPPKHLDKSLRNNWVGFSQPVGPCWIRYLNWMNASTISKLDNYEKGQKICTNYIKCSKWEYDRSKFPETVVSEWNLVCDRKILNTVSKALFFLGTILGAAFIGVVADRVGRKSTLFSCMLVFSAVAFASSFAPNFGIYLFGRIILGFFCISVMYCAVVLAIESVGGNWVIVGGVLTFILMPVAFIISCLISMGLPHWREYQLTISFIGLVFLLLWWCVPESPRWLLKMGRLVHLEEILRGACTFNRRLLPGNFHEVVLEMKNHEIDRGFDQRDLFNKEHRLVTFLLMGSWFSMMFTYFGIMMNVAYYAKDLYITAILFGVIEIPAILLTIAAMLKFGRMQSIRVAFVCFAIAIFIALIIKETTDVHAAHLTFVVFAKFFITVCFVGIPLYTAELHPTLLRMFSIGVGLTVGAIGVFLMLFLFDSKTMAPLIIMGLLGVAGCVFVSFLPETKGKFNVSKY